jgi:hypothetical protein
MFADLSYRTCHFVERGEQSAETVETNYRANTEKPGNSLSNAEKEG